MWGVKSRCVNLNSGLTVDKECGFLARITASPHHRITASPAGKESEKRFAEPVRVRR